MINVDEFIERMTTEFDVVELGNMIIEIGESHKELELKLKIAEDAINDSNRALNVYENVLCNSTLKRNLDALKQIRGE